MKEIFEPITDYSKAVQNIRTELHDYVKGSGLKSLIIGISGGIDSALCAALAAPICETLNIPLIGRSISIESNKVEEEQRAKQIGTMFCTDFKELDLTEDYINLYSIDEEDQLPEMESDISKKIRMGNIKARMRMIYLYNLASKYKGMVLSTDNYTELMIGFWTLHGDVGDYGMVQNLWKSEVYEMSKWLSEVEGRISLNSCIDAVPTDGLGITNSDLDQILPNWKGTSIDGYKQIDIKLFNYLKQNPDSINQILLNNKSEDIVIKRYLSAGFKRNWPINIDRKFIL